MYNDYKLIGDNMKKIISVFVLVVLLVLALTPVSNAEMTFNAKSVILMEQKTGKVLYEDNADEKLPPASVTKIMTLLLVMEMVDSGKISLTDMVSVSENAASMGGSQVFLEAGESMRADELIKSIVIASGNDAAVAMAEV